MLIRCPPSNHDHRDLVYDDVEHSVYCPGCGQLWVAQPSKQDMWGNPQWLAYIPVGRVVTDREPFFDWSDNEQVGKERPTQDPTARRGDATRGTVRPATPGAGTAATRPRFRSVDFA